MKLIENAIENLLDSNGTPYQTKTRRAID